MYGALEVAIRFSALYELFYYYYYIIIIIRERHAAAYL